MMDFLFLLARKHSAVMVVRIVMPYNPGDRAEFTYGGVNVREWKTNYRKVLSDT
jgi:hypothetical protein